jgi:hypothetical protein
MKEVLTQVGVGGIFAIVVLKEVFGFLKSVKNKNGKNGDKITRREFDIHKTEVQYKDNCEQVVKRLEDMNKHQKETADERHEFVKSQFNEVKGQVKSVQSEVGEIKSLLVKPN